MTPQNKNHLIFGGIALTTVIVLYLITKNSTSNQSEDTSANSQTIDAKGIAQVLYDSMKNTGTNEQGIYDILTKVTQDQFAQIVAAFGKKSYNTITGNQYAVWGFDLPLLGLKDWLFNELDKEDYRILKLKFPKYL